MFCAHDARKVLFGLHDNSAVIICGRHGDSTGSPWRPISATITSGMSRKVIHLFKIGFTNLAIGLINRDVCQNSVDMLGRFGLRDRGQFPRMR